MNIIGWLPLLFSAGIILSLVAISLIQDTAIMKCEADKTITLDALNLSSKISIQVKNYLIAEAFKTTQNKNQYGLPRVTQKDIENIYNRDFQFIKET